MGFKVQSDDSERLTIDHMIQDKDAPATGSAVVPAVDTLQNAMSALRARIAVLVDYVDAVESGKESANLEILRSIESVGSRLPIMTNDKFNEHFCGEIRRQTL